MITKRTAIRGRLAVRRAANRPPWSRRKLGHGAIVAPLAATVAATLAATVAVGVGVALARAERDRRFARVERARDRQFALLPGEPLTEGLRRMALSQLDLAIDLLAGAGGTLAPAKSVHETRKSLKRLRALVRLLRAELGEPQFARENAVLRDAGRRLAGARDAEVRVLRLDELMDRHPRKLGRRPGMARLRRQLVAERERATERTRDDAWARSQVVGELRALRVRVEAWTLPHRDGVESVQDGLRRIYRQGRRRRRRAARTKGNRGRAMHLWRKRVKDLRYAEAMLDRRDPDRGKRSATRSGRIRRLTRRADQLGDLLGEEHDLALLAARLKAGAKHGSGPPLKLPPATRRALLKVIARRRRALGKKALRKGKRLYRRSSKAFVRRIDDAYAEASLA